MIVVSVTLVSAIDGSSTELARMVMANDGQASSSNHRIGDYAGVTFKGRDRAALDRGTVSKSGHVRNWRRLDFHVWNLVRRMLDNMGYDK